METKEQPADFRQSDADTVYADALRYFNRYSDILETRGVLTPDQADFLHFAEGVLAVLEDELGY